MEETTTMFCAVCGATREHSRSTDANSEIVLTCPECEHFVKFPAGSDISHMVAQHQEANALADEPSEDTEGQIL